MSSEFSRNIWRRVRAEPTQAKILLHSFLPGPSSSSPSPPQSLAANLSENTSSLTTLGPTVTPVEAYNSTQVTFLYHHNRVKSENEIKSVAASNRLQISTAKLFSSEEHITLESTTPISTTSPSTSVDP